MKEKTRPDTIRGGVNWLGSLKFREIKRAFGRRVVGWAGIPPSFQKLEGINGAGIPPFFPRGREGAWRNFLFGFGNGLILVALGGLLFSISPLLNVEIKYRLEKKLTPQSVSSFNKLLLADLDFQDITLEAPEANFSIVIPKIKAASLVVANVDAGEPKKYNAALKKGVAHAAGTVFPGMKGTIFLFSHSTDAPWNIRRYNAVFYLLRELEKDDQIVVFFEGKKFFYKVTEKKIVERRETDFFNQKEEEVLVLQTCYPPGTTQKALLIMAKPVVEISTSISTSGVETP